MTVWVRFSHQGVDGIGSLEGSRVTEYVGDLFSNAQSTERTFNLDEVEILTPTAPTKMVAMANNFHALIEKFGLTVPEDPLYFLKANSSFHPSGQPIRRPMGYEGKIVFEGELGIVIGKTCKQVSVDEARQYVFGYTCVNDVTAFDLLNKNPSFAQWTRCKAADTFGVFGPAIATDLDPLSLRVRTLVDGHERQNYPITDMVFTPDELVSRVSYDMTLVPGDIIACGTSVGVGTLKPGNVVEITIDGVGTLRNEFVG
ncbi:MAG: fumarylacetoacetate hydrolase family protein [Arenicellales bacterium]|nr:fumarylacetoacetate hydrolase family protein [Arenicellales bacterium]